MFGVWLVSGVARRLKKDVALFLFHKNGEGFCLLDYLNIMFRNTNEHKNVKRNLGSNHRLQHFLKCQHASYERVSIFCIIVLQQNAHTQRDTQHLGNLEAGFDGILLG